MVNHMKYALKKVPHYIWWILTILFLISSVLIFYFFIEIPIIQLNGKEQITLTYQESFHDPGYQVKTKIFRKKVSNCTVTGTVNTKKIGTYPITYTCKYHNRTFTKKRTVKIVDQKNPELTLKGENPIYVCPKKELQEPGFQAIDEYDGDLTKNVIIKKLEDGSYQYQVKDSSNNQVIKTRKVEYKDIMKPNISLLEPTTLYLTIGSNYPEYGVNYTDNCDEIDSNKIVIENNVNTNRAGTYSVTYRIKDNSGNEASVTRTVKVTQPSYSGKGKTIYLTFDDGPSGDITPQILDILKEEGVKATFFIINHGSSLDYLIKREHNEGHTVALHSNSHNYGQIYANETAYFNDLFAIQAKVKNIIGVAPTLIRFPGGSSNTVSKFNPGIMSRLTSSVEQKGFDYFDWNVDSEDAGGARTSSEVYNNVTNALRGGNYIVLMHDFSGNYKTLNALRDIIRYGKSQGYTFAALSHSSIKAHHGVNN